MRPSAGSGVSDVTPASSSALLFTQVLWPSRFGRNTIRSGTVASRRSLGGATGNTSIDQPPPGIHPGPDRSSRTSGPPRDTRRGCAGRADRTKPIGPRCSPDGLGILEPEQHRPRRSTTSAVESSSPRTSASLPDGDDPAVPDADRARAELTASTVYTNRSRKRGRPGSSAEHSGQASATRSRRSRSVVQAPLRHQQDALRGKGFDELGVVAHGRHRSRPVAERLRDRGPGRWVEVVRGLVEEEEILPSGHELGERQLRLLAAGQGPGVLERPLPGRPNIPRRARSDWSSADGAWYMWLLRHPIVDPFVLLGVVAQLDAVAQAERALVGAGLTSEDPEACLAAPLRPMTRSRSPRSTSNVTSSKTAGPPYPFVRSSAESIV